MAGGERGNVEGRFVDHPGDLSRPGNQAEPVILAGRYQLGPLLGVGGMGLVYGASDLVTGNPVAYKTLRSDAALEPRVRELFGREQEALRRLNHHNVVQILDLIDGDDGFGIIMEYFPAGNLRDVLGNRQLDLPAKIRVAAGIASGLAAIHAQGIVHRDLKPPNVLVVEVSGMWVPKISDLGVARFVSESLDGSTNAIGTPTYMAPESTEPGGQQTPADVYALGVMLFELLVGRVPYEGESALAVLKAHADRPTPLVQGVAEPLSGLLLDLLAKNPANRPTAAEAEQRLMAVLPALRPDMVPTVAPPPAAPPPAPPSSAAPPPAPPSSAAPPPFAPPRAAEQATTTPSPDGRHEQPPGQRFPTGPPPSRSSRELLAAAAGVVAVVMTVGALVAFGSALFSWDGGSEPGPATEAASQSVQANGGPAGPAVADDGSESARADAPPDGQPSGPSATTVPSAAGTSTANPSTARTGDPTSSTSSGEGSTSTPTTRSTSTSGQTTTPTDPTTTTSRATTTTTRRTSTSRNTSTTTGTTRPATPSSTTTAAPPDRIQLSTPVIEGTDFLFDTPTDPDRVISLKFFFNVEPPEFEADRRVIRADKFEDGVLVDTTTGLPGRNESWTGWNFNEVTGPPRDVEFCVEVYHDTRDLENYIPSERVRACQVVTLRGRTG